MDRGIYIKTWKGEDPSTSGGSEHEGGSDDNMSYSDEYYSGSDSGSDTCEQGIQAMSIVPPVNSPYKLMLMKNIESCQLADAGQKKRNQQQQSTFIQTVFCTTPVLQVEHVPQAKSARAAAENAHVGDVDIFGDEDDGVGTLTNRAIDNKVSQVLVRSRGNRLTAKQAQVKERRVKAKAN